MANAGERPTSKSRREKTEDLLRTGFQVFRDVDNVAIARSRLLRDAHQPCLPQLQLCHANDILHAHAHGQVAGDLADQRAVCARARKKRRTRAR